ncbi:unnamed protein product (macronuclear) [Paramecium tetraurelia]|uniref:RRM domain-containing protein n=1 Tax=Paramecium tetraurelia TaxID=5888 RepID=A0BP90_PARTE|nr:uncharacterized protein GSPATT00005106001 [Paramecium tetraurelia]CAK60357.1 unnamed protein product [Paramecium tetraurelia]|eukprot:XP_001427755.1 hypothetical protein (macronuclear) [Paramecium tetraurelia strain d4-2]
MHGLNFKRMVIICFLICFCSIDLPRNQFFPPSMLPEKDNQKNSNCKLHIGNLPLQITEETLHRVFSKYGQIKEVKIIRKNSQGQPLKDYCYGFVLMCDGEGAQNAVTELKQNSPLGTTWTVAFSKDKNDDIVGTGHQKSEKIRKKDKSKERFKKDKTKPKKKKSETSSSSDSSIARSDKKQKKQKKKKQSSSSDSSSSKLPTRSALVKIESKPNDSNLFDMVFSGELQSHSLYQQPQSQYQIKHNVHVRELFISGIPQSKTQSDIQRIFSHYGIVERIDIIPKQIANFAYVKFKKLDAVNQAIQNQQFITDQLDGSGNVKIYPSDPFKRTQIVGNAEDTEKDEDMLPIMFIGFPPNQSFTIDEKFLKKMAQKYGGDVKGIQIFQPQSPQLRSYVLIEFSQLRDCKKARRKFCRYKIQILGDKKCDVAILSNYSANPQNKKQANPYMPYGMDYMAPNQQMPMHMMSRQFQPQMTMMQPYPTQPLPQQQFQQPHYGDYNQMPIMYPQQQQNPQQMMYLKTQSQLPFSPQSQTQQQFRPHQQQPMNTYYQQVQTPQPLNQNYTQQQFMDMIMPPPQPTKSEDSNATFWSGYMNRGKQHRVGIDARMYSAAIDRNKINLPCNLEMSYLCSYQDAYQRAIQDQSAVLIFSPAQESDIPKFSEYLQYLRSKQRAGVIQTDLYSIYVIPPGVQEAQQICNINQQEMIAIYCNKDLKI